MSNLKNYTKKILLFLIFCGKWNYVVLPTLVKVVKWKWLLGFDPTPPSSPPSRPPNSTSAWAAGLWQYPRDAAQQMCGLRCTSLLLLVSARRLPNHREDEQYNVRQWSRKSGWSDMKQVTNHSSRLGLDLLSGSCVWWSCCASVHWSWYKNVKWVKTHWIPSSILWSSDCTWKPSATFQQTQSGTQMLRMLAGEDKS